MKKIKDIPFYLRPREKALKNGIESLSNEELLTLIIKCGNKKLNAFEVAKSILYDIDDISKLANLTAEELQSYSGVGEVKSLDIIASIELGKRINLKSNHFQYKVSSPECITSYVNIKIGQHTQEHFFVILLDSKNYIIKSQSIFIGTLNHSIVHPRDIFSYAIKNNANSIIIAHNHPSGVCAPSKDDIKTTNKLIECSKIIQIEILDHIIVGKGNYFSFRENNII